MCGIVGYLGNTNSIDCILSGLTLLQNRGYDSVGISCIINNELQTIKYASTNTNNSLDLVKTEIIKGDYTILPITTTIGHTRWATHGGKTNENAHPHHDNKNRIAVVHNGIIENFQEVKNNLIQEGYWFRSQTDTEVISVLIGKYLDNNKTMEEAIECTIDNLCGTWALVIIHCDFPNKIWITRNGSPLLLGFENEYIMVASEQIAFNNYINKYIVLNNHDLIEITKTDTSITYSKNMHQYKINKSNICEIELYPTNYNHWMIKEIMEQPESVLRVINNGGRIANNISVKLGGLDGFKEYLINKNHLILLGCGTSYHSGLWAVDIFKELDIFETVSIYDGADFGQKDIPKRGNCVAILISQSGETKDLIRCIQIIQQNNIVSIGLVNVTDSYIARETNCGVYLHAGREVAVASTKSFTNQCIGLTMVAIWFSQQLNTCPEKRDKIIKDIYNLSFHIEQLFQENNIEKIKKIATILSTHNSLFILGKGKEEAIAKEGALKIKEVTYIHAEGYSSSALKHGPFGLIVPNLPIVLIDVTDEHRVKNQNAYQEINARNAFIIHISDLEQNIDCDNYLLISKNKTFGGLLANIYIQLLSYYCAIQKGYNPDFPRNLAKVVTVE
jgi:glucosamine--fructose-6-phosphate aminotransferase (isomerizing)